MSLIYTYDGAAISHKIEPSGISITARADMGEASFGGIPIEDPAGSLTLLGHRPFIIEEDDCAQPRLFTGWVTQRDIGRSLDRGMFVGANPRLHDTTIVDCNALFSFRQISGVDGNRPDETWEERLDWILNSDYLDGLISTSRDFTDTWPNPMDAVDYRGSTPSAVLDDLAQRFDGSINYFSFWDPVAAAVTLFFDHIDQGIATCSLSISNVYADVDSVTVFAPDSVAVLQREPDQTYSEVTVEYANGKVFRSRPSTAATYIRRGTTISRPYTGKQSTASAQAEQFLDRHATELDRITCSIKVPSDSVGLIQAGQLMSVRFSHMPGYETGTTMRIVSCSPKPTNDVADFYDIELELVYGEPLEDVCSYVPPAGDTITFYSSEDIFGARFNGPGDYIYHDPYVPATEAIDSGGLGYTLMHHANDGDAQGFGINSGVSSGGPITATWMWDLSTLGSPYICAVGLIPSGDMDEDFQDGFHVEASDNSTDWTEIVTHAELEANPWHTSQTAIVEISPWALYRYWRLRWAGSCPNGYWDGIVAFGFMLWSAGGSSDTVVDLGPAPGATTSHTTDPTVTDDADAGFTVGSHWINTLTGEEFVLVDATPAAAVWISTTATGGSPVEVLNEGTSLTASLASLDFVGAGVTATTSGDDVTVTIPGPSLIVQEADGTPTDSAISKIIFPNGTLSIASHEATYTPAASSGSIAESLIDAKGDLIVGSASDTAARLAVGATDGHVLTADSGQTLGMKWAAAPAGGGGIGLTLPHTTTWTTNFPDGVFNALGNSILPGYFVPPAGGGTAFYTHGWIPGVLDTQLWANPPSAGVVTATQSTNQDGTRTADKALDHRLNSDSGCSHTQSGANEWWKVDFGAGRTFTPTRLGICGRFGSGHPTDFKLRGSDDDSSWTDLLTVTSAGPGDGTWWSSAVTASAAYRYLQICQTATTYLILGEVEMWGTLE